MNTADAPSLSETVPEIQDTDDLKRPREEVEEPINHETLAQPPTTEEVTTEEQALAINPPPMEEMTEVDPNAMPHMSEGLEGPPPAKRSKPTNKGRHGDPRMHRAVAARLLNPELSLLEALLDGGFIFPEGTEGTGKSDRSIFDSDGVLLCQRKNQLSRRLRLAKKRQQASRADGGMLAGAAPTQGDSRTLQNMLLNGQLPIAPDGMGLMPQYPVFFPGQDPSRGQKPDPQMEQYIQNTARQMGVRPEQIMRGYPQGMFPGFPPFQYPGMPQGMFPPQTDANGQPIVEGQQQVAPAEDGTQPLQDQTAQGQQQPMAAQGQIPVMMAPGQYMMYPGQVADEHQEGMILPQPGDGEVMMPPVENSVVAEIGKVNTEEHLDIPVPQDPSAVLDEGVEPAQVLHGEKKDNPVELSV